jgi:hypothetical protein
MLKAKLEAKKRLLEEVQQDIGQRERLVNFVFRK